MRKVCLLGLKASATSHTPVLLFSHCWIHLFVFSHSHCYQVGRDTTPRGVNAGPTAHTHTHQRTFPPQRDQRRHSVGQNKDQLAVAWLVRGSFHVYFNGSLTPEKNSANVSFMKRADWSVSVCVYRTFFGVNLITGSSSWCNLRPTPPQKGIEDD